MRLETLLHTFVSCAMALGASAGALAQDTWPSRPSVTIRENASTLLQSFGPDPAGAEGLLRDPGENSKGWLGCH